IDLGTLSASAGLEYSYGPFLVGPVPVSISIGGSVTLEGRFAIGFDTRGLRSTLRGEAFSDNVLLDGIFIDDLDLNGNDVPEIKLEVSVYAGASVSVKVIEAGIRAGVTFGVELNWNDPNDDGKLRIDEIGIWAAKPICLFDRRGYIGFYLEFYLKFDFFLFSTTLSWRPVDETYELFNESCEPPKPILAEVDGDEQQLILYIGDNYANDRGVYNTTDNDKNEKVMVRQLSERGQGCKIGQ
ncbi:MAG: hypothetical protein GWN14_02195, partial [candidate division Zixibacteria bacterium]|nr:hypothetical protein [Gammaproteobacteria bacterium]NIX54767.1 hypothetical protein [candidate division Zixibacteria bacterium]